MQLLPFIHLGELEELYVCFWSLACAKLGGPLREKEQSNSNHILRADGEDDSWTHLWFLPSLEPGLQLSFPMMFTAFLQGFWGSRFLWPLCHFEKQVKPWPWYRFIASDRAKKVKSRWDDNCTAGCPISASTGVDRSSTSEMCPSTSCFADNALFLSSPFALTSFLLWALNSQFLSR